MDTSAVDIWMDEAEMWLTHLERTGRKEGTIRTHRNNLRQCLGRLQVVNGQRITAASITTDDVQFLWSQMDAGESTRRAYLRSLSGMVEYITGVDIVKRADILYNREMRDRIFITDSELRELYSRADETQRLIICLGAYMGLRRVEMHAIRDGDIDGNILTVHGKGHGEDGLVARVRIPAAVMTEIERYRSFKRGLGTAEDDYLLQTRSKRGGMHRMHEAQITAAITRLSKDTGIRVTTHAFRRFYGTTLYYKVEADIQTVRKLMRHADISTTLKCYIDAYDEREREATDSLSGMISELLSTA